MELSGCIYMAVDTSGQFHGKLLCLSWINLLYCLWPILLIGVSPKRTDFLAWINNYTTFNLDVINPTCPNVKWYLALHLYRTRHEKIFVGHCRCVPLWNIVHSIGFKLTGSVNVICDSFGDAFLQFVQCKMKVLVLFKLDLKFIMSTDSRAYSYQLLFCNLPV